jgi:hypothetical protein
MEMARKSDEEIRETAERVMQELDLHEAEAKARGERFQRIDEQTLRKLAGDEDETDGPLLIAKGWPDNIPVGATGTVRARIQNPDLSAYDGVYLYLFFGPPNTFQSIDLSLTAVDTRLPRHWQPVAVAANSSAKTVFPIAIPQDIRPGAYLGNLYLVEPGNFGNGQFYGPCRDSRQSRGAARGRRELVVVRVLTGVSRAGSVGP